MQALITGITSDLGLAFARKLVEEGYTIVGTYHNNQNKALAIKEEIKDKIELYKVDLTNEEEIKYLCTTISDIDVLINNACTYHDCSLEEKTKANFIDTLEVNLIAPFLLIKYLSPNMQKGHIINISSTDAINTYNEINFDYASSKAGLITLTKALSQSLPNIKLYTITPNWINTQTTKELSPFYLKEELKKSGQTRLIEPTELSQILYNIIKKNTLKSGTNIIVDIKNKKLEVKYE